MEKARLKVLRSHYNLWKKDDTRVKEFEASKQDILSANDEKSKFALVEAYVYIPKRKPGDILASDSISMLGSDEALTASQQKDVGTLPFVKILWSDDPNIKPLEIYSVKDKLGSIEYNKAHREWWSQRAQQPSLEDKVPIPPKFKMGWDAWSQFRYKIDKFLITETSTLDLVTFKIPTDFLITKSNI